MTETHRTSLVNHKLIPYVQKLAEGLSKREAQVAIGHFLSLTDKVIAKKLGIAETTVRGYKYKALDKLKLANARQLPTVLVVKLIMTYNDEVMWLLRDIMDIDEEDFNT